MPPLPRKAHSAGFGMIEVVVAFLLLSLSLGVLLGGLTAGLRSSDRAALGGIALLYAESLMAETGISTPLEPGETTGVTDSGYAWKRQISAMPDSSPTTVTPFAVAISVTPPDNGAPVRLMTLRLADKPVARP